MKIYIIQTKRFRGEEEVVSQIDRFAYKSLEDAEKQVAFSKDVDAEIEAEYDFISRKEYEILEITLI